MVTFLASTLIHKDGKLLMVQQSKAGDHGLWGYPGGRVEQGESFADAAVREAKEEVGLDINNVAEFKIYTFERHNEKYELHTHVADFSGTIQLEDGLLAYAWRDLEYLRSHQDELRGPVVLPQAEDYFANTSMDLT